MEYVRFGDLYSIPSSNGVSRPSAIRGEGYKMINMGELFSNDIIRDIPMERVKLSEKEKAKFLVKEGDLLFARQSLVASGAGKCSIVKELNEETTFESHLIRVRLDNSIVNPWYYYYLFQLPYNPVKTIVNQCAQAGIRGTELVKIKVPLPPIKVQNKVAETLSTYDDLIENNNKRIAILEQMAENLYKEWFVRFRFPGYENAEFEDGIPVGWKKIGISDVYDIKYGKTLPTLEIGTSGEFAVYGANGVIGYYDKFNCDNYVTLITSRGNGSGDVLRTHHKKSFITNNSFTVTPKEQYNYLKHEFTYWLMKNVNFKSVCSGAAQPQLTNNSINSLSITLPDSEIINSFCNMVGDYFALIENLLEENENLIKQRDLLLPRLMSGKLEV